MTIWEVIFWLGCGLVVYTYVGYGCVVWVWLRLRDLFKRKSSSLLDETTAFEPAVTLLIAAYNEADCIVQKATNSLALDYPAERLRILFVTDGSTDGTPDALANIAGVEVLHQDKRAGKIAAIHRAMQLVDTPIVVFSDANTLLNTDAIRNLVQHYRDAQIGAVAGEKRVLAAGVSGSGEGFYWRYESFLKKQDARLYSVVGAAGELFSIRTALYEPVPADTLLDDFMLSLRIAEKGYRVAYAHDAIATELPSASLRDEMTRKVRISAGGFQSMARLLGLLNIFRHGKLTFQYVSHRVLRWTLAPLLLPVLFALNAHLAAQGSAIYVGLWFGQLLFYGLAIAGAWLSNHVSKVKWLFIPLYFCHMNWSVYRGFHRYLRGKQSVLWERAARLAEAA